MAERVLITGGCGLLGQGVMRDLLSNGYEVVLADRVPPRETPPAGVRYINVNMLDVGEVAGAARGCDAIVHLAAYPTPYRNADEVVFSNNTGATFAVLQAASLLGIKRVAIASSGSIYGTAWSPHLTVPAYVPVDEDMPFQIFDAYALSKEVDERTAEMFSKREGMSVACLRFHWIATREEQLSTVVAMAGSGTNQNNLEPVRNVWGYVDIRDAARACRLAIEVAKERPYGFVPMNIDAADTLSETPTEELIRTHAPGIEIRHPIPGTAGAYDISRAKEVIGWEPLHSWRNPE